MAVTGDETETGTSGDLTACQLHNTSSSLPQGVAATSTHSFLKPVDPLQKREHRLMRNRNAAKRYRRRRMEDVHKLLNRHDLLEQENEKLKAELQCLKRLNIQRSCLYLPPQPSQPPP
ncbi:cyclic AMP-dependent transcription factor ATF-1-like isoform X1 [Cottoperca gobio]|uniref:Cyclic AMP-dependent transcription factor ATF-1-like isoform X1 n=1 Tax=Cottoperca gobio TaxID=56716 RepID=A0A6J2RT52_COTGO|nr:cyclic AMP-dependent transcription factor ATF-1-like isoform X1 [Cottoperca gobio]